LLACNKWEIPDENIFTISSCCNLLVAGFHISTVQLGDGSLMALTRKGNISDYVTKSISKNMGDTWTYYQTEFPGIGGGQRSVLIRLNEGPILYIGFTKRKQGMMFKTSRSEKHKGFGMFAGLSYDEGKTWPDKKLITIAGPSRQMDGGGNTHKFTMDETHAEHAGYLAATQTPDNVIHLISSRLYYSFNLNWLKTPASDSPVDAKNK